MKRTFILLAALLMIGGCADPEQNEPVPADSDSQPATAQPATPSLRDSEVIAIGDSAAVALTTTLMGRVRAEIERAGPAAAVDFCSMEAMPLTASVADSLAGGLTLKRTSRRLRNPANAPDALEQEALAHFEAAGASPDGMPEHLLQHTPDGWRFYKPMTVAPLCTTCHGPPGEIDPTVRQVLAERYPDDQATGYAAGDFRGLVRVAIPEEALW